ncbi:restriction endonuclease subunit S [Alcanivorax quisquiliarum]|uniref:Restriction endonuclease subunit S n=1 Tax=Alcanivorax quisquiliarum TaxID=2933565 RepID=A0ABT0E8F2_9GAMM|nr:restriction endonuclease subunit S [Alcanivorax quisquiliarum]MCK0538084.1 restriction endonuclease subunit S [Alcanivorax quisquiliarum]
MSGFKPYPAYKDSGVEWLGKVPEHWALIPIKHLASLNPRKSDFQVGIQLLCSFVPMEKLKTGVLLLDEERQIKEVINGYTYFEDGDVLQAKVTPCFENKNIAIATGLTNGIGFGSSEINVLRPNHCVKAEYLYYRLQEDNYMDFCTSSMMGAGGLKRVPTNVINNFTIAAPGLAEQTQIARFLDHETARIDALIEEQQRLIELLKEKRQAVISHAVTKGLDPTVPMKDSGVEWLGEVPAHWEVVRLGALYSEAADKGLPGLPVLQVSIHHGVSDKELTEEESDRKITRIEDREKYKRVRTGDLVYNMMRAWQGGFGAVRVEGLVSPAYVVARPEKNFEISRYVEQLLRTDRAVEEMRRYSYGITDFRLRLYWDQFKNIRIALPPEQERQEIMKRLALVTGEARVLEDEAAHLVSVLRERRSALISAAVTGKIDVRNWQPATADKLVHEPMPMTAEEPACYKVSPEGMA